jgi:hypothetical protein
MKMEYNIDMITQSYIKEKPEIVSYFNRYSFCNNIHNFIIANLYNLIKPIAIFLYINDFNLSKIQIDLLFLLNKSMKLITLNMFVEKQNKTHIYNKLDLSYYDDSIPIKIYHKKYVSAFIKNNEIHNLQSKIKKYNLNKINKYKLKLLFKNDIKQSKLEKTNLYDSYNNNAYNSSTIDNYEYDIEILNNHNINTDTFKDVLSVYVYSQDIHYTIKNIDVSENFIIFQDKLKKDITNNYTEILLYEDAFETQTDLVKLLYKFIM